MKKLARVLLVLGFAAAVIQLITTGVQAQVVVTFDENGTGTIVGGPFGGVPIPLGVAGTHPLVYTLPAPLAAPGDLIIYEDAAHTQFSDLVRFDLNVITFYSDLEPNQPLAGSDLADVTVLPTTSGGVILTEVGTEGNNGVQWTPIPGSGAPGDSLSLTGFTTSYVVISDIPEPGTVVLVGIGMLGLLAVRRRKK
jgi:hypothetical protein